MSTSNNLSDRRQSVPRDDSLLLELIPGLKMESAMTKSEHYEFREWWHETVVPELVALTRLIGRL
jgi:hypothetical protein